VEPVALTRECRSFDHDFLAHDAGQLPSARGFASTRIPTKGADGTLGMSRLYVVESGFSLTGGQADHRLRLAPSRVVAFAVALAKFILPKLGKAGTQGLTDAINAISVPDAESIDQAFLEECSKDLMAGSNPADRAQSVVLAGRNMPPEVHAIAIALNDALGSLGKAVQYLPMSAEDSSDSLAGMGALAAQMAAGQIKTLVCIETNPVFNAPADLHFADLYKKVPTTVCMSVEASETAHASTWSLNGCHYLECWGDTLANDGTIAPIQPMIAPLFGPQITSEEKAASEADRPCPSLSEIELLSLLSGDKHPDGYQIVRATWSEAWKKITPNETAESENTRWRRSLHNGVMEGQSAPALVSTVNYAQVAAAAGKFQTPKGPAGGTLDVVFGVGLLQDGRFANVPWLQELPQIGTMVCWDNPALMSPKTAVKLGLWSENPKSNRYTEDKWPKAEMAEITVSGRTLKIAVWILPGMADDTVILTYGYGRDVSGLVGDGVGFNTYTLRASTTGTFATGAAVKKVDGDYWIASTQNHWSMEGRTSIVRALDLPAFAKHAGDAPEIRKDPMYGTETTINLAERLGELAHSPPNQSIYAHPYNNSTKEAAAGSAFSKGPQWGMTIDLSSCTGCGVCTIACQAENNIPSVGKKETAKGREMTWIRLDRYFAGYSEGNSLEMLNNPSEMMHQPVACVHCESAPCETVCPVNATIHTKDGLNSMAYNRCIGTRYCANNCPYKVRRFNYFDFGVTKFNGGYLGKESMDKIAKVLPNDNNGVTGSTRHSTWNPNLIPPRLREKLDQLSRMQKNPDVSVRSRGVMEKCSYCVQRINAARIECNLRDNLDPKLRNQIPDGFLQTACQQACPSNSITFGDILDTATTYEIAEMDDHSKQKSRVGSRVVHTRNDPRSYALLGFLNTRPRTSHMLKVRNPNALLLARLGTEGQERIKSWEHPFHHAPAGHGEEGHEGSDHAPKKDDKHAFFDSHKRVDDGGYALSLRVLGTTSGAHA
ncbi:MAG: 4Fe-4S dicluster domain-containing protein, partial [Planctomycetota bacterium]